MSAPQQKPEWVEATEEHMETLEAIASSDLDLQLVNDVIRLLEEYRQGYGMSIDPVHPCSEYEGFVYLAEAAPGQVKIGHSKSPKRRVKTLNTANPADIELLIAVALPNSAKVESELHSEFSDSRLSGEWFDLGEKQTYRLVDRLHEMHKEAVSDLTNKEEA